MRRDIGRRVEALERAAEKVHCSLWPAQAIAYFLGSAKRPNEWFDGLARALGYPSWVAMSQPMAEEVAKKALPGKDAEPTEFYRRYVNALRQLLQQFGDRGALTTAALQKKRYIK